MQSNSSSSKKSKALNLIIALIVIILLVIAAFTTNSYSVRKTFWSLVPPMIAIVLALITKEVYSSLFSGVLVGGLLYSGFDLEKTINHVFRNGIIGPLSNKYNIGILIFLVILGTLVCLMNKAGGSAAFGNWASGNIKTRVGAQCATIILGILIFIDDYFNCLTVGSVMRPITDKYKISRAKLAYLIDATAAPVCIIAPISSWAAAVSGFIETQNGINLFIKTIPFNFYALLTIIMMFILTILKIDFGPMALHEKNAILNGDLFSVKDDVYKAYESDVASNKSGKVIDLIIPIASLIICCTLGMIYTGGFFSGESFINAFAKCDAATGLVYGSFFSLVITLVLYILRRVLVFNECMKCVTEGFNSMTAPILILTFAWALKSMTDSLGAQEFVAELVRNYARTVINFMPCILFLISSGLAFATGTSWGTFGILIPIVVNVFEKTSPQMMIISMSACMAGAVCGDHASPISDTMIMSAAGAQCDHISHVTTQFPYIMLCALVSATTYIIAGFTQSALISLPVGVIILVVTLAFIRYKTDNKHLQKK